MANETDKITLEVELREAQIVLTALAELPWRVSNELIGKLSKQIQPQVEQPDNVTKMSATGD
jgi:hypothetical protein